MFVLFFPALILGPDLRIFERPARQICDSAAQLAKLQFRDLIEPDHCCSLAAAQTSSAIEGIPMWKVDTASPIFSTL